MYEAYGYNVNSWRRFSPKLNDFRVIVWAPDDFAGPGTEQMEFLNAWLKEGSSRTLVYVGRDYDAIADYWLQAKAAAEPAVHDEMARRVAQAQAQHDQARVVMPDEEVGEWFVIRRDRPRQRVTSLTGPWSGTVDATQADLWIHGRLAIPTEDELATITEEDNPRSSFARFEPLLKGNDVDLAYRVVRPDWGTNQVIVVANGSFLLNLPLVNAENRKLAGALIRDCQTGGEAAGKVAFIESGPGGPPVYATEGKLRDPEAARRRVLLAVHWIVLGVLYCLSIFPVFGRAKSGPPETAAEFSQHVDAVGSLLQKTHDYSYAKHQLQQYRENG
jgi:hypothetical protein